MSMAADLAEDLDADRDAFEMANLYPRTTGLPMTVWVSVRGGARHDVRVKVAQRPGDRLDPADVAVVAVRPEPRLLHGELAAEDLRAVSRWIRLNEPALVGLWEGELDGAEFALALRRV